MLRFAVPLALMLACAAAQAQSPQPRRGAVEDGRRNQRIERIVHEDAGNRIEELRYAGQTQSITVQPKGEMPAWEVAPATPSRGRVADERGGGAAGGGQRFWNVLDF